jgi:tRNA(Ile)-lysidine synthase
VCGVTRDLGADPPVALHIHHGLQAAADDWQAHCERVAADMGARFLAQRVIIDRAGGESLEAAAREARMAVFARIDVDAVLLAQHRDDQAETVLLNALRGSGVDGLAAIPQARSLGQGRPMLLRPFIELTRAELETYARDNVLRWIEDPSNADTSIRRNLLRHRVLPLIDASMPQARSALARLASHAAEARHLAEDLADLDAAVWSDARGLRCSAFAELPPYRARNLLRRQLALAGTRMPDSARLDEMLRQLTGDGRPEVIHDGRVVTRRAGRLCIREG